MDNRNRRNFNNEDNLSSSQRSDSSKVNNTEREVDYERLKVKFNFNNASNHNIFRKIITQQTIGIETGANNISNDRLTIGSTSKDSKELRSSKNKRESQREQKVTNQTPQKESTKTKSAININHIHPSSKNQSQNESKILSMNNSTSRYMSSGENTMRSSSKIYPTKEQNPQINLNLHPKKEKPSRVIDKNTIKTLTDDNITITVTERKSNKVDYEDEILNNNYRLKEAFDNFSENSNSLIQENILRESQIYDKNKCNTKSNNLFNINGLINSNSNIEIKEEDSFNNLKENVNFVINFNNIVVTNSYNETENSQINYKNQLHNNSSQDDTFFNQYRNNSKVKKVKKNIFQNNPSYNLSSRMINDEKNRNNISKHSISNKVIPCKFIDIIKSNAHLNPYTKLIIPFKKFLVMKDESFLVFLMLIFDNFENLKSVHRFVESKIKLVLRRKYVDKIVNKFREEYKDDLELYEYYYSNNTNTRKVSTFLRNNISVLSLYIKSKVVANNLNQSAKFSLIYKLLGKNSRDISNEYIQTWQFDIRKKSEISFWMASEAEEYQQNITRYCYVQPILSFAKEDFLEIKISIFSKNGCIDPNTIQWSEIIYENITTIPFLEYEKSATSGHSYTAKTFDKLRFCELENAIHMWKHEKSLTNRDLVDQIYNIFQKSFKILNFTYDFSKFYFFKVKMQAKEVGVVKRNKYFNFDIEILPYEETVTNEIQSVGLLNYTNRKYQVRVGEYFLFYFTDLY